MQIEASEIIELVAKFIFPSLTNILTIYTDEEYIFACLLTLFNSLSYHNDNECTRDCYGHALFNLCSCWMCARNSVNSCFFLLNSILNLIN